MKRFSTLHNILLVIGIISFLSGCAINKDVAEEGGDLVLNIASQELYTAQLIEPPLDMTIKFYDVYGTGPGGASFQQLDKEPEEAVVQTRIKPGVWTIIVKAKNASLYVIGEGTTVVNVLAGKITQATVTVYPVVGTGTLDVTVTWPNHDGITSLVPDPRFLSTLESSEGITTDITFIKQNLTEANYKDSLNNGYYKLSIKFYDGDPGTTGKLLWGTMEAARIITGQVSSKTYKLVGEINMGYFDVLIDPELHNPITITFTGAKTTLPKGQNMTIVATITDENGITIDPVDIDSYEWYLQGNLISGEITNTITIGSALDTGTYQLDLLVAEGPIFSSATVTFTVVDEIVFSSNRDGNYEIYKMDSDGAYVTQLTFTDSPIENKYPAWSKDKSKIAFMSTRDVNKEIYVINADGSGVTKLTNNTADDISPTWSPDGNWIAFVSNRDGDNEIYIMDSSDGSSLTQLTNNTNDDADPAWSPGGIKIAFSTNWEGLYQVYRMNTDGLYQENITKNFNVNDRNPDFSPNGLKITYVSDIDTNNEIYVKDAAPFGTYSRITNNNFSDEYPAWASWGDKIVFASNRDGNFELYTVNIDKTGLFRLTNNTSDDIHPDW